MFLDEISQYVWYEKSTTLDFLELLCPHAGHFQQFLHFADVQKHSDAT
jgi:hypothetical protein